MLLLPRGDREIVRSVLVALTCFATRNDAERPGRRANSKEPWLRQWRDQLAFESLGSQLGCEFCRDVPEDDRAIGLVLEHAAFLDHGDQGSRHVFADLQ
jgi:hypothetical protein